MSEGVLKAPARTLSCYMRGRVKSDRLPVCVRVCMCVCSRMSHALSELCTSDGFHNMYAYLNASILLCFGVAERLQGCCRPLKIQLDCVSFRHGAAFITILPHGVAKVSAMSEK
eukprot:1161939-Pelagomonas_calceolata.AAC.1